MNQWSFVVAAYALTFAGTGLLSLVCWRAMRSAEMQAQSVTDRS